MANYFPSGQPQYILQTVPQTQSLQGAGLPPTATVVLPQPTATNLSQSAHLATTIPATMTVSQASQSTQPPPIKIASGFVVSTTTNNLKKQPPDDLFEEVAQSKEVLSFGWSNLISCLTVLICRPRWPTTTTLTKWMGYYSNYSKLRLCTKPH